MTPHRLVNRNNTSCTAVSRSSAWSPETSNQVSKRHSVTECSARPTGTICLIAGALGLILSACTSPEPSFARKGSGISHENRLALNRLALNRLALNRLALNRLALNRLSSTHLVLTTPNDLAGTPEGRELLAYVAQCVLLDGDVLVVEHEDGAHELPGLLGLAPEWETRPLTESEQRLVSACLLAHVNAYGESVSVSLRAGDILLSTGEERRAYPVYEGTFFGQVFDDDTLVTHACAGSPAVAALEHSADRHLRVCTDATDDCEIASVGRCRDVCETRSETAGWTDCWAGGVRYTETISVYLAASDPDGMNQRCESDECEMCSVPDAAAILDCDGSDECAACCEKGAICTIDGAWVNNLDITVAAAEFSEIDCYETNNCQVECREGAICDVDCFGANNCKVACERGAQCDVHCENGNNCNGITCRKGASCAIDCNGVENCGFAVCDTGALTCPGDIIVCGRPCP